MKRTKQRASTRPPVHNSAKVILSTLSAELGNLTTAQLRDVSEHTGLHLNTLYGLQRPDARPRLDTVCLVLTHLKRPLVVGEAR